MITPMKKATIVVLDSRRAEELENLKHLGLLHPEIERRNDERTEGLQADRETVLRALAELPAEDDRTLEPADRMAVADEDVERVLETARTIKATADQRRNRREVLEKIDAELARVALWGSFDPDEIRALGERGIDVHLFSMPPRDFRKRAPEGAIVLERGSVAVLFAMIWFRGTHRSGLSPDEIARMPGIQEFRLPDVSPEALRRRREEEAAGIDAAERELAELASHRLALGWALAELEQRLRDEFVRLGMDTSERVAYITGYIPADSVDALKEAASRNGWGTLIRDPEPDDIVPTKVKTSRLIGIIRPVFGLLGVVPGYRERDISFFFLIFFIVFVGMIIGDGGYGLIQLIAGIILFSRSRGRAREGAALLLVLSLSTLAWGAITGNWFGYAPIGRMVPFRYFIVPALDAFDPRSAAAVQAVCFVLAVMHLSIAHVWNFVREVRERPAIKAFAQLGWLAVVLGLYFLIMSLFLGTAFPAYGMYLIGGGMAAVILLSGQTAEQGFFGGVANGLKNGFTIVFDGISAFSDIISYIRLFAVGLATVAIAQAFNEMAASIGTQGVAVVAAIVVLFFGHTLNLVMAWLAVVVHGVRLNLLEFSGHLGMEWTGIEYQPFSDNH